MAPLLTLPLALWAWSSLRTDRSRLDAGRFLSFACSTGLHVSLLCPPGITLSTYSLLPTRALDRLSKKMMGKVSQQEAQWSFHGRGARDCCLHPCMRTRASTASGVWAASSLGLDTQQGSLLCQRGWVLVFQVTLGEHDLTCADV